MFNPEWTAVTEAMESESMDKEGLLFEKDFHKPVKKRQVSQLTRDERQDLALHRRDYTNYQ